MTTPLVNHLHFYCMTDFGITILLGQASDIPDLNLHIKIYLQKLAEITRYLPDKAQPISLEECIK